MRIVSGKFKSRRFSADQNIDVRPTTDLAKESLFNILNSRIEIEGLSVLDLFCGIGSISLEFISRGAKEVCSIDSNYKCIDFIKSICKDWDINALYAQKQDAIDYLVKQKSLSRTSRFDIIFADPPYAFSKLSEIPNFVLSSGLLKPHGIFILEHGKDHNFCQHPNFLEERRYGKVHFSFFCQDKEGCFF